MGNGISIVRNGTFVSPYLRIINLSENPITVVETGAFASTPDLRFLFMGGCGLTRVPRAIQGAGSSLLYLFLSINRISELRSGDFDGMTRLSSLEVCLSVVEGLFVVASTLFFPFFSFAHKHAHMHIVCINTCRSPPFEPFSCELLTDTPCALLSPPFSLSLSLSLYTIHAALSKPCCERGFGCTRTPRAPVGAAKRIRALPNLECRHHDPR